MCKNIRDVIANCFAIRLPIDYPFYISPCKLLIFFPSLTEMILFQTLVLLLFSHANALLITQNVAFQKVNEITTTRSRWLVTFIIDLEPYEHFINKIGDDFVKTDKAVSTMSALQDKSASHGFYDLKPFFSGVITELKAEIASMNTTYTNLRNTFATIKLLQVREKRSLLPFIGSALNFFLELCLMQILVLSDAI